MIGSLMVAIGYFSSNFELEKEVDEMAPEQKKQDQGKPKRVFDATPAKAMSPKEESRVRAFVLDKLAAFRPGSLLSNSRSELRLAKRHIAMLTNHCQALREENQSAAEDVMKTNQAHETKLSAMSAEHKALDEEKILLEKNLENLQRTYKTLSEKAEKTSKQLKSAETNVTQQSHLNTTMADKLKKSLLKESTIRKEYDVKRAEQQAIFHAKYDQLEATFKSKNKQQEAFFSKFFAEKEAKPKCQAEQAMLTRKYEQQQATSEAKFQEQEASYKSKLAEQEAIFTAKSQEQLAAMSDKLTAQQAMFDADYKAQGETYNTKCAEQQAAFDAKYKDLGAMLDLKYNKQKVAFNKMLQGEWRKLELLGKEKEALSSRLQTTEIALLKSRQIKVTQEYQFKDTMNGVVPRDELKMAHEECVLYRKIMSVMAALVLVLVTVVFIGSRFLL